VGVSLLPKLTCPLCWPAYAGLLSALGLGFLLSTRYLLALTATFLIVAVGTLGFRASKRHGYGPVSLGLVAAALVLFAKFRLESNAVMYGGLGLLIAASVWNSWPQSAPAALVQLSAKEKSS
jgi:hypothetical protein